MGIGSLVLGIIAFIISFIPFLGAFAFLPALIAVILGIVDIVKKSKAKEKKGIAIAGVVLSAIAIVFIVIVNVFSIAFFTKSIISQTSNTIYDYDDNYLYGGNSSTKNKTGKMGETVTLEDLKVTFSNVNTNYTDYNKYANVKSGYVVMKADFEFENIGSSTEYISSYRIDCYADGYSCDSFYYVTDSSFSSNLASGKKTKGSVYFEIPSNADSISLEYVVNSFSDSKIVFNVK